MMSVILLILRIALGGFYAASGWMKLMAPTEKFAATIAQYDFVRGPLAEIATYGVPWAEFLGGIYLILGLRTAGALRILWALNTAFVLILSQALVRNLPIRDCGCFGQKVTLSPEQTLLLDIVTWALFLLLHWQLKNTRKLSLDSLLDR